MPDIITQEERQMIAEAVKAGAVRVMPPRTFSQDCELVWCKKARQIVQKDPGNRHWRMTMRAGVAAAAQVKRSRELREKLIPLIKAGGTAKAIAEAAGCHVTTVQRLAQREGLQFVCPSDVARQERRKEAARLFDAGHPQAEIARRLGTNRKTIRGDLQAEGRK